MQCIVLSILIEVLTDTSMIHYMEGAFLHTLLIRITEKVLKNGCWCSIWETVSVCGPNKRSM